MVEDKGGKEAARTKRCGDICLAHRENLGLKEIGDLILQVRDLLKDAISDQSGSDKSDEDGSYDQPMTASPVRLSHTSSSTEYSAARSHTTCT
jgi:hypothetical protein